MLLQRAFCVHACAVPDTLLMSPRCSGVDSLTTSRASSVCGDEHGSEAGDSVDAETLGAALAAAQVPYTVSHACGVGCLRVFSRVSSVNYIWQTYDASEPRPTSSAKARPCHILGAHQSAPRLLHTATASAATGATALVGPTAACSPSQRCAATAAQRMFRGMPCQVVLPGGYC